MMRLLAIAALLLCGPVHAAAPVLDSSNGGNTSTNATSSTIAYPTTIAADSLCFLLITVHALENSMSATFTAEGFTTLVNTTSAQTAGVLDSGASGAVAYRWLDSTAAAAEQNTTFSVSHSSEQTAYFMLCFTGAMNPSTDAPEASTPAIGTTGADPDATAVTHSTGSADYGYLAYTGLADGLNNTVTAPPSGYSDGAATQDSGSVSGTITSYGYKRTTATTTEDAGAFSATENEWVAITIAIPPASSGGGGGTIVNPITGIGGAAAQPVN
jgi:hypothetical protein